MKTPNELAEEHAAQYSDPINKCVALSSFVVGYEAGRALTEQEIVDILTDLRKREEEDRNKLPAHQEQRHARIWEKIKIKMIGVV
jgi:hypothetical protein